MTEEPPEIVNPRKRQRKRARKASVLLRVYRRVFKTDAPKTKKERDAEPPNIRLIRDIKEKNPGQFLGKLQDLEKEYAASRGEGAEAVQMDEGSRKVLDLVDGLLDEIGKKAKS